MNLKQYPLRYARYISLALLAFLIIAYICQIKPSMSDEEIQQAIEMTDFDIHNPNAETPSKLFQKSEELLLKIAISGCENINRIKELRDLQNQIYLLLRGNPAQYRDIFRENNQLPGKIRYLQIGCELRQGHWAQVQQAIRDYDIVYEDLLSFLAEMEVKPDNKYPDKNFHVSQVAAF